MSDKEHLSPIVPERDDRISQRPPAGHHSNTSRKKEMPPPSTPASGGGPWKLLVLLLLTSVAGVGWFAWQQSLALGELRNRFNDLSARIESTDESLSQSGAAISIKLKDQEAELEKHWSEIKKLWGVAYDTNRKAIADNKATVDKQVAALKKTDQSLQSKLDQFSQKLDNLGSATLAASAEMEELQNRLQTTLNKLASLEKSYRQQQSSLGSRIAETERAIESIDAYRRQVNQQLTEIRQQLRPQP